MMFAVFVVVVVLLTVELLLLQVALKKVMMTDCHSVVVGGKASKSSRFLGWTRSTRTGIVVPVPMQGRMAVFDTDLGTETTLKKPSIHLRSCYVLCL